MIPHWKQLQLPGGSANDNTDASLDDVLGDAVSTRPTAPQRELAHRLHVAQGRAARVSGNAGEHWVERHHIEAKRLGLVSEVAHVGPPGVPHVVGGQVMRDRRGRFLQAVIDYAPPDYLGGTHAGHLFVAEVKRRTGRLYRDRLRPDGSEERTAMEPHQVRFLRSVAQTPAAVVLLVVEFERAKETVRIAAPWAIADTRWCSPRGGAPSLGPDELIDWRVPDDCPCYLLRFIDPPR